MPSNKKPRKKYKPKGVFRDPVGHVLQGMTLLTPGTVLDVRTKNHNHLSNLVRGNGNKDDWKAVTGALNMAIVLDEQVYDGAYYANLLEALRAHGRCGVRHWNGGNFGYSGKDLAVVNLAFEVHDAQLERSTVGEIERAMSEAERRSHNPKENFSVRQLAEKQKENACEL